MRDRNAFKDWDDAGWETRKKPQHSLPFMLPWIPTGAGGSGGRTFHWESQRQIGIVFVSSNGDFCTAIATSIIHEGALFATTAYLVNLLSKQEIRP